MDNGTEAAVKFIVEGGHKIVALQFPDEMLETCVMITEKLQRELHKGQCQAQLHILADSAYDGASVDTIAAEHVHADCVIHYGEASLNGNPKIPTLYVFSDVQVDVDQFEKLNEEMMEVANQQQFGDVVVFMHSSVVRHRRRIEACLCSNGQMHIHIAEAPQESQQMTSSSAEENVFSVCGYEWQKKPGTELNDCLCVWIGPGLSETLEQLQLHAANSPWIVLDSFSSTIQHGLIAVVESLLRRRAYLVEKAKEAEIIGILVSTLSTSGIINVVNKIRELARAAEKQIYEIVVAKPTPAKLANFPEVDVFVSVCDPHAMILDSKEFLAPLITPYEAQVAFTGEYLQPRHYQYHLQSDLPTPSPSHSEASGERSLVIRGDMSMATTHNSPAANYFLTKRHYHGLDKHSNPSISPILPGRSGTASHYTDEPR